MTEELKPCPFCGSEPKVTEATADNYLTKLIKCYKCDTSPFIFGTSMFLDQLKLNCDKQWNNRPREAELLSVIKELRQVIVDFADDVSCDNEHFRKYDIEYHHNTAKQSLYKTKDY